MIETNNRKKLTLIQTIHIPKKKYNLPSPFLNMY